MTGRYHYRTGVVDTPYGRSMMYPEEVTIAEALRDAGYRTGIFGKWHLGDNYPLRAMDQGFEESLVHGGGGITQAGDWPGNTYFDPMLRHNGSHEKYRGYCTDIFTAACMEFVQQNRSRPFFGYLSTNAPHGPLQVDEAYAAPFRKMGLDENTARTYGMVVNIDENVGKILKQLSALELERESIVIFMTDNGPGFRRYNAGMRGYKGTQYEGGLRVPFFIRWPGVIRPGTKIDRLAVHMDIFPTLLEACGVTVPSTAALDGKSLMPLIRGQKSEWPDREIFFQWHPGEQPELYRNCAVRTQRYKFVNGTELYDLAADPAERTDIAGAHPEIVAKLRHSYEAWFEDMTEAHHFAPPRIVLGTDHENPAVLSRQDFRGPDAGWNPDQFGYWEVDISRGGQYKIALQLFPAEEAGTAHFRLNDVWLQQKVSKGDSACVFPAVSLAAGPARLTAYLLAGYKKFGARYVEVQRL